MAKELHVTVGIRILPIKKRYYWPHKYFLEARRNNYNCYVPWKLYIDLTVDYRYFISINGNEEEYNLLAGNFVKCLKN